MITTLKVWSGSAWVAKPAKAWSGSVWVTKPVKVWSGSAWISSATGGPPYLDSFDRANANLEASPTASGDWTWTHDGTIAGALTIVSNQLNCATTDGTGSAYKTPALASADHYVQFKALSVSALTGPFACCRLQDRSNFVGIRAGNDGSGSGRVEVYRRVSGILTNLYTSASSSFAVNDIIRLECTGSNFTVKKNGTVLTGPTAIGGTFTALTPGIVARTSTAVVFEDFEAGTLASFIDNFNRTNANLEASPIAAFGGSWTHDNVIAGGLIISSNIIQSNTNDATGTAYKTPALSSADHFIQYKITIIGAVNGFACCRLTSRTDFLGIRVNTSGVIEVFRRIASTFTNVYTSPTSTVIVGDIIRLEAQGTNFTVRKNGVLLTGPTAIGDASLTNVGTGIVARSSTTATWDDFEAGIL